MTLLRTACVLLLFALLTAGCASKPVYRKIANAPGRPPWRVVVLPAIPASPEEGKEVPVFEPGTLDDARTCLALKIPRDAYRLISLPRVDLAIPFDQRPVKGEAAIARAGRAMDADLVIQPELFAWDRSYYVIHSVARVGMRAKLYDGKTGALLGEASREQVRNQGIQKIPLWTGGLIYGPIRGILHEQMAYLCDSVATRLAEDLTAFSDSGLTEGQAGTSSPGPATD